MTADVTIIIPVFGDVEHWRPLSGRAEMSALLQTHPAQVVVSTADTLTEARNGPGVEADTEWLVYLDADDELDPGYVAAMLAGAGDLRQPATLGVLNGVEDAEPVVIRARPLLDANYLVIGTMIRTELFRKVGGFRELRAYEDWDLFIRCWLAGAEITACPDAVYRVHVNPAGRNTMSRADAVAAYHQVRRCYVGQTPRKRGATWVT